MRRIVVGIDPGSSIGIAIADLSGNIIHAETVCGGKEEVVKKIIEYGTPSVIVADVPNPPSLVTNVASYFNARVRFPKGEIPERMKTQLAKSAFAFKSAHERDAIAAIVDFFKKWSGKLRWIERVIKEKNLEMFEDEVKHYVLMGISVEKAVKAMMYVESEEKGIGKREIERREKRKRVSEYLDLIKSNARLRSRLSILEAENALLKERIASLERDVKNGIAKDREITKLKLKIKKLNTLLNKLREAIKQDLKRFNKNMDSKRTREGIELKDIKKIVGEYRRKRGLSV